MGPLSAYTTVPAMVCLLKDPVPVPTAARSAPVSEKSASNAGTAQPEWAQDENNAQAQMTQAAAVPDVRLSSPPSFGHSRAVACAGRRRAQ